MSEIAHFDSKKDTIRQQLEQLSPYFSGDIYTDETWRRLYATDASAYRELPTAVIRPRHKEDLKKIIAFAKKHQVSLIPRTAGTSLAGQVVGDGIIVDMGKYMNRNSGNQ